MATQQQTLAGAFAQWSQANPGATDADIAQAMQQAGVNPYDLSIALGIDPEEGMKRFNAAIPEGSIPFSTLDNQLTSTPNPLMPPDITRLIMADKQEEETIPVITVTGQVPTGPGIINTGGTVSTGNGGAYVNTGGNTYTAEDAKNNEANPLEMTKEQYDAMLKAVDARLAALDADPSLSGAELMEAKRRATAETLAGWGINTDPSSLNIDAKSDAYGMISKRLKITEPSDTTQTDGGGGNANGNIGGNTGSIPDSGGPNGIDTTDSSVNTSGQAPIPATGATVSPGIDSTGAGEWVYDANAGVFRQTGGIETIVPKDGTYTDGQVVTSTDMQDVFGEWGANSMDNPQVTPTDWMGIFNTDGVQGVIDVMSTLNKSAEDVAAEANVPLADVNQAISNHNAQGANGSGTGGTGDGSGTGGTGSTGTTVNIDEQSPLVATNVNTPTQNTVGAGGGTGGGTGDGTGTNNGWLSSLVNNTPITSRLFKPELFKVQNKTEGLFELVMGARKK